MSDGACRGQDPRPGGRSPGAGLRLAGSRQRVESRASVVASLPGRLPGAVRNEPVDGYRRQDVTVVGAPGCDARDGHPAKCSRPGPYANCPRRRNRRGGPISSCLPLGPGRNDRARGPGTSSAPDDPAGGRAGATFGAFVPRPASPRPRFTKHDGPSLPTPPTVGMTRSGRMSHFEEGRSPGDSRHAHEAAARPRPR